jgi:hypothetical protein
MTATTPRCGVPGAPALRGTSAGRSRAGGAAQLLLEAGGWFGAADGTDLLEALPFEYSDGWIAVPPSLRDQLLAVAQRYLDGPAAPVH